MSKELTVWKLKACLALFLGMFAISAIFIVLATTMGADSQVGGSIVSLAGTGGGIGLYLILRRKGFGLKGCFNHQATRSVASCHSCERQFCQKCLEQVGAHYYCKSNEVCLEAFAAERKASSGVRKPTHTGSSGPPFEGKFPSGTATATGGGDIGMGGVA